jgi:methylamine dehydrogenase accessory protein MauD
MLIVSNVLLWVVVVLLVVAVLALARQLGVLRARLDPGSGFGNSAGPGAGDRAPVIAASSLAGGVVNVGAPDANGPVLLLFVTPDGAACRKMVPVAMVLARSEGLRLVFVGQGTAEAYANMAARFRIDSFDFATSAQATNAYRVAQRPEAVLVAADGTIAARGRVKSREHLENLIVGARGYVPAELATAAAIGAVPLPATH